MKASFENTVREQVQTGIGQMSELFGSEPDVTYGVNKGGFFTATITSDKSTLGASVESDKLKNLSLIKGQKLRANNTPATHDKRQSWALAMKTAANTQGTTPTANEWKKLNNPQTSVEEHRQITSNIAARKATTYNPILLDLVIASGSGIIGVGIGLLQGMIAGLNVVMSNVPLYSTLASGMKTSFGSLLLSLETFICTFGTIFGATALVLLQMLASIFIPFAMLRLGVVGYSSISTFF